MSAPRTHLEALMRERPYNFICAAIDALDRLPNNHRLPKRALADLKRIREDLVDASVDLFHARQELQAQSRLTNPQVAAAISMLIGRLEHQVNATPHPERMDQIRALVAGLKAEWIAADPALAEQEPPTKLNPMPIHVDDLTAASWAGVSLAEWQARKTR